MQYLVHYNNLLNDILQVGQLSDKHMIDLKSPDTIDKDTPFELTSDIKKEERIDELHELLLTRIREIYPLFWNRYLQYKDEFEKVSENVLRNFSNDVNKKKHPYHLIDDFKEAKLDGTLRSDRIRKIHDFYGWMAKMGSGNFGHCSGCMYRTLGSLLIPPTERDGSKSKNRNIHVEHLIPVKLLRFHMDRNQNIDKRDFLTSLLDISICVGLSHEEERLMNGAGVPRSKSEDLSLSFGDDEKPFLRYKKLKDAIQDQGGSFLIFDLVRGQMIDLDTFTLSDHRRNLRFLNYVS